MSTTLEVKLRTAAAVNATLQGYLGTDPFRWYDVRLKQGTAFPAVTAQMISNGPLYSQTQRLTPSQARMQLSVWGPDAEQVRAIEAALTTFFDTFNAAGSPNGLTMYPNNIVNTRQSLYTQTDPPLYQRIMDVMIYNDETT